MFVDPQIKVRVSTSLLDRAIKVHMVRVDMCILKSCVRYWANLHLRRERTKGFARPFPPSSVQRAINLAAFSREAQRDCGRRF